MPYSLGVDLGTTFTAAAVDDGSGPTMVGLGNRALQIPSVLFLDDGELVVGEPAERRGSVEPDHVVREFKRRLGDHVPLLVGGSPFSAEILTARLLEWVVERATERMGEAPAEVVVTHPANWGPFKMEVFAQVMTLADVRARLVPEPVAAAAQYASRARVEVGDKLAVYDLGGGTFDVCVVEKTEDGFAVLGQPEGAEHLGGTDLDHALFGEVMAALADRTGDLNPDDPAVTIGLTRLRRECVEAKEALSTDMAAIVPVSLPGLTTTARVTRSEFETLIRPPLEVTVAAMRRALRSASLGPADLTAIVLIGGSSRIPLVGEMLQRAFGLQPALDTHPKHDVALGAVRLAAPRAELHESVVAPSTPAAASVRAPGSRARWPLAAGVASALAAVVIATLVIQARGTLDDSVGASPSRDGSAVSANPNRPTPTATPKPTPTPTVTSTRPESRAADLPRAAVPLPADELLLTRRGKVDWDIWRMTIGGVDTKRLTLGAGSDTRSVLSTDRRTFIYLHEAAAEGESEIPGAGPTPDVDGLRVMAVDGTGDRRLFTEGTAAKLDLGRPGWSRDGTKLASRSRIPGKPDQLVVLSIDGTSHRTIAEAPILSDPGFTPDGRRVTYWASERTGVDGGTLMSVPVDGGAPPVEILPGEPGQDADPAWSPDGTTLAFRRQDRDGFNVWVVRSDGTGLRRLTSARGPDQDPSWSPDGRRIVFRSARLGEPDMFVMNADGTDQKLVVHHPEVDGGPAWTRR